MQRLATGTVGLADTAAALHVSPRTLQRKLRAQNTNYQAVLDAVRADTAEDLVTGGRTPLAEVAFVLGYNDQSTFNTAYKRWHGTSPGRARRQAQT